MNFVSCAELLKDVEALAAKMPDDLAGVVGIPRSGMMVASLLALSKGVHLSDLEGFVRSGGAFFRPGNRVNWEPPVKGSVVVVDDSVHGGQAMESARRLIRSAPLIRQAYSQIIFAAVYVSCPSVVESHQVAVTFTKVVEQPRIFQWNLWTHPQLRDSQCDLDGVICEEPPPEDDGTDAYWNALKNRTLKLLHRPQQCVAEIVTGRLENYRDFTQTQLHEWGINYKKLTMCPATSPEERRRIGAWLFKAKRYKQSGASLFIESCAVDADQIAAFSGKPVLCVEDWKLRGG